MKKIVGRQAPYTHKFINIVISNDMNGKSFPWIIPTKEMELKNGKMSEGASKSFIKTLEKIMEDIEI